ICEMVSHVHNRKAAPMAHVIHSCRADVGDGQTPTAFYGASVEQVIVQVGQCVLYMTRGEALALSTELAQAVQQGDELAAGALDGDVPMTTEASSCRNGLHKACECVLAAGHSGPCTCVRPDASDDEQNGGAR